MKARAQDDRNAHLFAILQTGTGARFARFLCRHWKAKLADRIRRAVHSKFGDGLHPLRTRQHRNETRARERSPPTRIAATKDNLMKCMALIAIVMLGSTSFALAQTGSGAPGGSPGTDAGQNGASNGPTG